MKNCEGVRGKKRAKFQKLFGQIWVGERMRKIPFCIPFEGGALKRNNWL
jgi:hypothetical protein